MFDQTIHVIDIQCTLIEAEMVDKTEHVDTNPIHMHIQC